MSKEMVKLLFTKLILNYIVNTKSLRKEGLNEVRVSSPKLFKQNFSKLDNIKNEFDGNTIYDSPRRRKMESTERQLYNLFEERGK